MSASLYSFHDVRLERNMEKAREIKSMKAYITNDEFSTSIIVH
jgi:hypothetical protein